MKTRAAVAGAAGEPLTIETPWADVRLDVGDWAAAFDAAEPGSPHNEAREQIWEGIVTRISDQHDGEVPADELDRALRGNEVLRAAFDRAWPVIDATDLVGDEYEVLCVKGSGWDMAVIEPAGLPAVKLAPLLKARALAVDRKSVV